MDVHDIGGDAAVDDVARGIDYRRLPLDASQRRPKAGCNHEQVARTNHPLRGGQGVCLVDCRLDPRHRTQQATHCAATVAATWSLRPRPFSLSRTSRLLSLCNVAIAFTL